jgi:hypothetical protein
MNDYWFKQTLEDQLFPDLMWSKPEHKSQAGKLLIIGGSSNGFAHTVSSYTESLKAGAGSIRVLIPDSTKKLIGHVSEDIVFGASTKCGGFAGSSLGQLVEQSEWSDAILISGELGNNSETTILFEKFLTNYKDSLVISEDAFDFSSNFFSLLTNNHQVIFVLDFSKLQKLSSFVGVDKPITSSINFVNLIEILHTMSEQLKAHLIIEYNDFIIVASQGYISTTDKKSSSPLSIKIAANSAVWYMQNKTKIFESLTCAAVTCQT